MGTDFTPTTVFVGRIRDARKRGDEPMHADLSFPIRAWNVRSVRVTEKPSEAPAGDVTVFLGAAF